MQTSIKHHIFILAKIVVIVYLLTRMHRLIIFILLRLFFLILLLVNLSEGVEAKFHFICFFSLNGSFLVIKCLEHPIGAVNVILPLSFFMVELFLIKVLRWLTTFR